MPQKIDDDDKRCAGKRDGGGKGGNVSQLMVMEGIGERIDDRINEGCTEGIDESVGEVVGEVCGDGVEDVVSWHVDEAIRYLCACRAERGEMVCCDVCESWSHLSCMGMKEGVGILEGKKFVCHFCLSACVMELRWEVKGLREELDVVTDKLRVTSEENEKLKRQTEQTEQKGPERVRRGLDVNRTGSMTGDEKVICDSLGEAVMSGESEKPTVCHLYPRAEESDRQRDRGKNRQISRQKEPRKAAKVASGVRKVWGTRKKVSCSEIAKEMVRAVGKVSSSFSVMKRMDQLNGKRRWWFIVKAPEKSLLEVDERWEHKHWQWQKLQGKAGDFLGEDRVPSRHK